VPVVGVLRPNRKDVLETFAEPFRRYMKAIGWEEGRSVSSKPQVKKRHRLDCTDDASSRARLLYIRLCPLQATSVFWAFRSLADRGLAKAIASRFGSRLVSVVPIAESVCSMVHVAMHLDSRGQR
jgi:hypothetical protein